jgi:hypothetical protein
MLFFFLLFQMAFSSDIDPKVYLQKYEDSVNRHNNISISYKLKTWKEQNDKVEGTPYFVEHIHRRQSEKAEWIGGRLWDDREKPLPGAGVILTDERTIFVQQPGLKVFARISPKDNIMRDDLLFHPECGSVLSGQMYGNGQHSICDLLKSSDNLKIEQESTTVSGVTCTLISGDTEYGHISLWVAPEMEYEAMKWEIEKNETNRLDNGRVSDKKLSGWVARYQVNEVTKDADRPSCPKKATFSLTTQPTDCIVKYNYEYEIKDIDYNPDFKKLNAFTLKSLGLPEGTKIFDSFAEGITYVWNGDKMIPLIDEYAIKDLENTCNIIQKKETEDVAPGISNKDIVVIGNKSIKEKAANSQTDNDSGGLLLFSMPNVIYTIGLCLGLGILTVLFYWIKRKGGRNE